MDTKENITIEFRPAGKLVQIKKSSTLTEAMELAVIELRAPCGGNGVCGKCIVIFEQGAPNPTPTELEKISKADIQRGVRLGCQIKLYADSVIFVPEAKSEAKILTAGSAREIPLQPAITKRCAEIQPPSVDDLRSDLNRILHEFGIVETERIELSLIQKTGQTLRTSNFKITGVFEQDVPIGFEPGDTSNECYGVGLDIGTTTLAAYLLDLNNGNQLSIASAMNPQAKVGDDVISRISYVMEDSANLQNLQKLAVDEINGLIKTLAQDTGISKDLIYELVVVGNTCMTHLFLGINPSNLAIAPYVPAFSRNVRVKASELGIKINPGGRVHVLPNIAGYVGGDTVGVILSSGFYERNDLTLAVDIGTNGEIVLGYDGKLLACSTAAGPAFEGAHIKHGMRAAPGAIDAVWLEGSKIRFSAISGGKPIGICGSGLLDAVISLIHAGIIEPSGRIVDADEIGEEFGNLRSRLIEGENGNEFVLATPDESANGDAVVLTQKDVREVQLAKGAIAAGIRTLMDKLGVNEDDLDKIVLAGAFGNYLRKESAIQAGMLPDAPLEKVVSVGNAAGEGAKLALLSLSARLDADRIAENIEYVELTTDLGFQERFADALMFGNEETSLMR